MYDIVTWERKKVVYQMYLTILSQRCFDRNCSVFTKSIDTTWKSTSLWSSQTASVKPLDAAIV